MKRRLFFMLPDVTTARAVLNELLLARVDSRRIHFMGRRDTLPPDLPEASFLQKTDIVHALRTGGVLGAIIGAAGSAYAGMSLPTVFAPGVGLVFGGAIVGAFLGAWFASLAGSSVPNSDLRAFQPEIERGKVLLIIDVPFRRVDEIRELVSSHHPDAEWGGVAPQTPAFP